MQRPQPHEYADYYSTYIQHFPDGDLIALFQTVHQKTQAILRDLTEEQGEYAYAEGKWTIKQVVQHMIDVERIMAYRALRIGRGDTTELAGFDENMYAQNADVSRVRLSDLAGEFHMLRLTTMQLFSRFTEAESLLFGTANGYDVSVRALAFIILGHELHHVRVLQERYLSKEIED